MYGLSQMQCFFEGIGSHMHIQVIKCWVIWSGEINAHIYELLGLDGIDGWLWFLAMWCWKSSCLPWECSLLEKLDLPTVDHVLIPCNTS